MWELLGEKIAITICEDIWEGCASLKEAEYHKGILETLSKQSPTIFLNLSASPYHKGKVNTRISLCQRAAKTLNCPVILCNQVGGNDGLVFDGHSIAMDQKGELKLLGKGFKEDLLLYDTTKETLTLTYHYNEPSELYEALVLGVRDYFHKSGLKKGCLGLSGVSTPLS